MVKIYDRAKYKVEFITTQNNKWRINSTHQTKKSALEQKKREAGKLIKNKGTMRGVYGGAFGTGERNKKFRVRKIEAWGEQMKKARQKIKRGEAIRRKKLKAKGKKGVIVKTNVTNRRNWARSWPMGRLD